MTCPVCGALTPARTWLALFRAMDRLVSRALKYEDTLGESIWETTYHLVFSDEISVAMQAIHRLDWHSDSSYRDDVLAFHRECAVHSATLMALIAEGR